MTFTVNYLTEDGNGAQGAIEADNLDAAWNMARREFRGFEIVEIKEFHGDVLDDEPVDDAAVEGDMKADAEAGSMEYWHSQYDE